MSLQTILKVIDMSSSVSQISRQNMRNLVNIHKIREYALMAVMYADAAMNDNREITWILFNKDFDDTQKAQEILSLFEEREIDRELDQNPQCKSNCEFEANLLRGLKQIRELAVGINSGNYAEKELVNESF